MAAYPRTPVADTGLKAAAAFPFSGHGGLAPPQTAGVQT